MDCLAEVLERAAPRHGFDNATYLDCLKRKGG
jgi:hypothetical protein